jgi:MerR family mercuric resistance operon transcriptional regulator
MATNSEHIAGKQMTKTISKVARELDINIETVRFYERRGLIAQPTKPEVGYRHYPEETVDRIRFIKRAQELGFTLEEIANLLSLDDRPCSQVQGLAEHKLNAVKEKMADLRRLEEALKSLLDQCHSNDDENHCPIIGSLQP